MPGCPLARRDYRLLRLAAFQNPEFYRAQSMRLSSYDKPRVIACAEDHAHHIGLPRGCGTLDRDDIGTVYIPTPPAILSNVATISATLVTLLI
jgi:hypothetical protein